MPLPSAAGEPPAGDAADETGDMETAEELDFDTETVRETEAADEAGELAAPPEELKIVVSVKGRLAVIGVQCPSADPHIESFDDPDLFRLADEFPAVVARAKAQWEEEPRHPAYVKPAPPPRQWRQRQQATVEADTTEGIAEWEQQQPETLRMF